MSDGREDVSDRLANRFEDEGTANRDDQDDETTDADAGGDTKTTNAQNAMKAKNVKKAWNAKSIYLPDSLDSQLSKAYKRLDLELDDDIDQFKKTRHFYPLIISAGIDQLEDLERKEILERIERIE